MPNMRVFKKPFYLRCPVLDSQVSSRRATFDTRDKRSLNCSLKNRSISICVRPAMKIDEQATATEIAGDVTSPSRANIYRERATGLRAMAAYMASPDVRKDWEGIALQYQLAADSIEQGAKSAGVENPGKNEAEAAPLRSNIGSLRLRK